jgi:hypothetical protein
MGWNKIGNEGAIILLKALTGNEYIKNLILYSINISHESTEMIKDFLISTPISELVLEENNLGDGIQNLAAAIKINSWLKTLNLSDTGLNHDNIGPLAEALIENNTLETLRLSDNLEIGDLGVEIIANMLPKNNSLRNLDLINVNMGDDGAVYLAITFQKKAEQLQQNLDELDLANNSITSFGADKLKAAISEYDRLTGEDNEFDNLVLEEKVGMLGE